MLDSAVEGFIDTVGDSYSIGVDPAGQLQTNRAKGSYNYFLPSANIAFNVTDDFLIRVSGSQTMQRASIADLAPSTFFNATNLSVTGENQSAARGRIMDADFAAETSNMSRAQILQQAGTAMVAQANQLPQQVLQLLRRGPMSAGELSDQFDVSKPTMSAHFAVLKEADLVHAEKVGKSVIYHLKLSVLEDALLGFVHSFGAGSAVPKKKKESAR